MTWKIERNKQHHREKKQSKTKQQTKYKPCTIKNINNHTSTIRVAAHGKFLREHSRTHLGSNNFFRGFVLIQSPRYLEVWLSTSYKGQWVRDEFLHGDTTQPAKINQKQPIQPPTHRNDIHRWKEVKRMKQIYLTYTIPTWALQ